MIRLLRTPLLSIILLFGAVCFCIWQNNSIVITRFNHFDRKIPGEFNNFTIVQISDLHNKKFGPQQKNIIEKIKSISPDIIVVTGDLIDRRKYDLETALTFIEKAVEIAPVYYVSGNHEIWSGKYDLIRSKLIDAKATVLDDEMVTLSKGSSSIQVLGLAHPGFLISGGKKRTDTRKMKAQLQKWSDNAGFQILLSHRPDFFDLYKKNNMDIIFSGHSHGGQFRIPGIGGLLSPDQGFFPKYDGGRYSEDGSVMYVSRGLGNSLVPIRIFNRPEIIAVTLKAD